MNLSSPSYVFTADTCGVVCMWNLRHHNNQLDGSQNAYSSNELSFSANSSENTLELPSVVRFQSCFNVRIVCVDAYPEEEVCCYSLLFSINFKSRVLLWFNNLLSQILVCGDQRGNIVAFSVPLFSPLVWVALHNSLLLVLKVHMAYLQLQAFILLERETNIRSKYAQ